MPTIYGPQTWPDTFSYPSAYQSSDHGGGDTPNADYPELAAAENVEIVVGTGPSGENVVDAVDTGDYTTAGVALCGVGDGSLATLQYDARGLTVEWDHFFKISGLAEADHGQLLVLADGGPDGDSGGLFGANVFISVEAEGTGGANFDFEVHRRRFTGATSISGTSRNPALNFGSGTADDAWHRMKLVLTPSTVTGAFAGDGTLGSASVASDGAISLYRDGVLLATHSGLNFVVNYRATSNPEVYYGRAVWHGFSDLLGPVTGTHLYSGSPSVSPDIIADESAQCCASDAVEGSGVAAPGAGVERDIAILPDWTPRLEGGATNPDEPPLTDPEDWSENLHRLGRVSVTLAIRKYPNELGTATYRFSTQPIPGKTGVRPYTRPWVVSYGDVARNVSSLDGPVAVPSWTVRLDDKAGLLRGLLADPTTNGLEQGRWEVTATIASEDLLAQEGAEEVILFRGIGIDATPDPGRGFSLEVRSIIGGHLKGYDLDKKIPLPTLGQCFGSNAEFPEANRKTMVGLGYGENSDHGTEDIAGNNAEKGLVPPRYVGKRLISDGYPGTPPTAPVYMGQVTNLQCVVTGSGPTMKVAIGVSLMTHFGETPPTVLVVNDYPVNTSGSHYATWTWDLPVAYADQIVYAVEYVGDRMNYPKYFLDGGGGTPYTPATSYVDDGDDSHTKGYRHGPVKVNTAQVAEGAPGVPGSGPMFWDMWSVQIGVVNWDVVDFYGAELAGDGTTKRVLLDASTPNSGLRNAYIIAPGDDEYPDADPWYIDDLGNRQSVFYSRGAISLQAINGNVGFALNIGGYTANPDGTGLHFTEAGEVVLHCLSNWWGLDPTVPVYSDGATWNDYPRFANGDCKLNVAGIKQFQADTATAMANERGAQFRRFWTEPFTLRDFLTQVYWTFYARIDDNHFGQLGLARLPHGLSATGTIFRDRLEIRRWLSPQIDRRVATEITYLSDHDAEMEVWRREPITIVDDDALEANDFEPLTREVIEMPLTGDPLTARVSAYYFRELFKRPRRWVAFEASYRGLSMDTTDPARVTHYDGLGVNGESLTQAWIDGHAVQPSRERVALRALDISLLEVPTIAGLSPLGDEDAMSEGNLGDEESDEAPPVGAYELVDEDA